MRVGNYVVMVWVVMVMVWVVMVIIWLLQQFVTDRKIDEEIGSIQRFHGDVDDLLPHIMGFGRGE